MRCFAVLTFAWMFLVACSGCEKPAPAPTAPAAQVNKKDGDHDHGDHGHEHADSGPHNGQIIELGDDEYHAELVHDDATHTITIYLLDGSAEKSVTTPASEVTLNVVTKDKPQQFSLAAKPQPEDAAGTSTCFELISDELCEILDDSKTKARVNITIGEKSFVGEINHADHEHHDHDHQD